MLKVTSVLNGDHILRVKPGGTITLDTGVDTGTVVVTGDLLVQGNTTTVESVNMSIQDNIILLNQGEQGDGITLETSGIRVDRGTLADAYVVFDETVSWSDPVSDTTVNGAFVFKNEDDNLVGIRTTSITTGGQDLYLVGSGTGVVSVTGTNAYETRVTDDDHVPNKKYVDDAIVTAFGESDIRQIKDGVSSVSRVRVNDFETTGNPSSVIFDIDTTTVVEVFSDRVEFHEVKIDGTTIATTGTNQTLTLSAPGTGDVAVNDVLKLETIPSSDYPTLEPSLPTTGVRIYAKDQSTGGTGIYYANGNETRDELISNNRSLLYSMIF